jgi:hypothetical protein
MSLNGSAGKPSKQVSFSSCSADSQPSIALVAGPNDPVLAEHPIPRQGQLLIGTIRLLSPFLHEDKSYNNEDRSIGIDDVIISRGKSTQDQYTISRIEAINNQPAIPREESTQDPHKISHVEDTQDPHTICHVGATQDQLTICHVEATQDQLAIPHEDAIYHELTASVFRESQFTNMDDAPTSVYSNVNNSDITDREYPHGKPYNSPSYRHDIINIDNEDHQYTEMTSFGDRLAEDVDQLIETVDDDEEDVNYFLNATRFADKFEKEIVNDLPWSIKMQLHQLEGPSLWLSQLWNKSLNVRFHPIRPYLMASIVGHTVMIHHYSVNENQSHNLEYTSNGLPSSIHWASDGSERLLVCANCGSIQLSIYQPNVSSCAIYTIQTDLPCEPILASVLYEKRLSIITTSGSLHYYSLASDYSFKPRAISFSLDSEVITGFAPIHNSHGFCYMTSSHLSIQCFADDIWGQHYRFRYALKKSDNVVRLQMDETVIPWIISIGSDDVRNHQLHLIYATIPLRSARNATRVPILLFFGILNHSSAAPCCALVIFETSVLIAQTFFDSQER